MQENHKATFIKLREDYDKVESSFIDEVFPGLNNILNPEVSITYDISLAGPDTESAEILTPHEDEKELVINSLKSFVDEKGVEESKEKKVSFTGGEIALKVENIVQRDSITMSTDQFLSELNKCNNCNEKYIGQRKFVETPNNLEKIKVLFVNDSVKSNDDSSSEYINLLNKMALSMNLKEEDYLITSLIKCFNPEKTEQSQKEMSQNCLDNFYKTLYFTNARVVVPLGAFATNFLLNEQKRLSSVHGKFFPQKIMFGEDLREFQIVPIFHPQFLLINPNMKRTAWIDLQKIMKHLNLN